YKHYEYGFNDPLLSMFAGVVIWLDAFMERHDKLFMVLATIAIAWFTRTLYVATNELRNLAQDQKRDMGQSLAIAKTAADAAKASADVSREALEAARAQHVTEHRPW